MHAGCPICSKTLVGLTWICEFHYVVWLPDSNHNFGRQWNNQNPSQPNPIYDQMYSTPAGPCTMLHRRQFGHQAVRAGVHADAGQAADQGGAGAPQPAARHPPQEELTHRRWKSGKDPGPTTKRKIHVMVNAVCSNS